jgi:hypothetical protein
MNATESNGVGKASFTVQQIEIDQPKKGFF